MTEIEQLAQRIAGALGRLEAVMENAASISPAQQAPEGVDDGAWARAPGGGPVEPVVDPETELGVALAAAAAAQEDVARLSEALEVERAASTQLVERLRAVRERQDAVVAAMERRIEKLTGQLDTAALEVQRQRKAGIHLRETLRTLREAAGKGISDPHMINKAMATELESLRISRHAEITEMEDILSELEPVLAEAEKGMRDAGG